MHENEPFLCFRLTDGRIVRTENFFIYWAEAPTPQHHVALNEQYARQAALMAKE